MPDSKLSDNPPCLKFPLALAPFRGTSEGEINSSRDEIKEAPISHKVRTLLFILGCRNTRLSLQYSFNCVCSKMSLICSFLKRRCNFSATASQLYFNDMQRCRLQNCRILSPGTIAPSLNIADWWVWRCFCLLKQGMHYIQCICLRWMSCSEFEIL
jgi:hypothetical protein